MKTSLCNSSLSTGFRLIALDIDGTVLDSRKTVPEGVIRAAAQAARMGKTLVFCSGRSVSEMEEVHFLLPMIRYAVFSSGAGIYDYAKRQAFELRGLSRKQTCAILAVAQRREIMPHLSFAGRDVIQESHLQNLEHYHMGVYRPMYEKVMTRVEDIFAYGASCRETPLKLNLYHADPGEREKTRRELCGLDLEKVDSEVSSLECSASGVDKGQGLLRLCRRLGIPAEGCIAVGDGENDLPMLRAAGMGIAMGNASERVRAAADRVVPDLDHGGCALAIRLLMGEEPQEDAFGPETGF